MTYERFADRLGYDRGMRILEEIRARRWLRIPALLMLVLLLAWLALVISIRPSNQRDWSLDQDRLATAQIKGERVLLRNVRNTRYRSVSDFDVRWEERRVDLTQLESLWYLVEPFSDWRGPAHTFLSFGFADGQYLAISAEIRKERGESFSPLKGILRQYELMYVLGDERDLIGLRANHRHDAVYLYPIRTTPEKMHALLRSMLARVNQLAAKPEFYNTLTNNCTSNIVNHIESIAPGRVPLSFTTLLPAYSDNFAYDLGLIATTLPRDQYRAAHQINEMARVHADFDSFSKGIRSRPLTPARSDRISGE